jgi:hypothetical protein
MPLKHKKRMGRPPIGSYKLHVAVPPQEMDKIEAWIKRQPDKPTRPAALRRLAQIGLAAESAKRKWQGNGAWPMAEIGLWQLAGTALGSALTVKILDIIYLEIRPTIFRWNAVDHLAWIYTEPESANAAPR